MKLSHHTADGHLTVFVTGEVNGSSCNCLEHFWERHVDAAVEAVRLDISGVTEIDAEGARVMVRLLRRSAAAGAVVRVVSPPTLVADIIGRDQNDERSPIEIVPHASTGGDPA